jgi:hypothetical protein
MKENVSLKIHIRASSLGLMRKSTATYAMHNLTLFNAPRCGILRYIPKPLHKSHHMSTGDVTDDMVHRPGEYQC